jgi:hypothetical protein
MPVAGLESACFGGITDRGTGLHELQPAIAAHRVGVPYGLSDPFTSGGRNEPQCRAGDVGWVPADAAGARATGDRAIGR